MTFPFTKQDFAAARADFSPEMGMDAFLTACKFHAEIIEAALELAAKDDELAKFQPCGCVVCTCANEERCMGCGAKSCGKHPVSEIPNPVYKSEVTGAQ